MLMRVLMRNALSKSLLGAVGAAAILAPTLVAASALKDIQVGEEGRLMRIALICDGDCGVEKLGEDAYQMAGVYSALDIPLSSRSNLVRLLRFEPNAGGAVMKVVGGLQIESAAVNSCEIGSVAASCIDLAFIDAPAPSEPALKAAPSQRVVSAPSEPRPKANAQRPASRLVSRPVRQAAIPPASRATSGATQSGASSVVNAPATSPSLKPSSSRSSQAQSTAQLAQLRGGATNSSQDGARQPSQRLVAPPTLRDDTNRDVLTFARFAPPERLSAPALAFVKPVAPSAAPGPAPTHAPRKTRNTPTPGSTTSAAPPRHTAQPSVLPGAPKVSVEKQIGLILDRHIAAGDCEAAQVRLNNDAWALDSMIDLGFCHAVAGRLEEADQLFSRLLAYTPDNYHALVGRALIAAEAGERSVARKFYQDALNALPPIDESNRIVHAMNQL